MNIIRHAWILSLTVMSAFAGDSYNWQGELQLKLEGFAAQTTGGYGGIIYTVTNNRDYQAGSQNEVPGSLRYGIEKSDPTKPLWVKFNLPVASKKILLLRPIDLRSNMSLDGRNQDVTIASLADWSHYYISNVDAAGNLLAGSKRAQCDVILNKGYVETFLLVLNRVKNVIITGLNFDRDNFYGQVDWEKKYPNFDKQCLGDLISIYNDSKASANFIDNIWIHGNTFQKCGDGCIDMVRPDTKAQRISISENSFNQTDKTMILGTPYDAYTVLDPSTGKLTTNIPRDSAKYYYRVSLYRNTFNQVHERNPRVSFALVHMYDNTFLDWTMYLVFADQSKVFYEKNKHRNSLNRPVVLSSSLASGSVYSYLNVDMNNQPVANLTDLSGYTAYRDKWITYSFSGK